MKLLDRQAEDYWSGYRDGIIKSTPVDKNETADAQKKRVKKLEADPEEWFKYYFPKYCTADPAPFHKAASKRILSNPEWYEVRAWSRELAKSTRTMFEVMYLVLTKKKRNVIIVSNSEDNAIRLLQPYKINLEANGRIAHDYGNQVKHGAWESSQLITEHGVSFRALGAGQSPRGTRNEEIRPDAIIVDDIDTDEECRNPDIIDKKWQWIEKALIPTRSISTPLLIIFCGNIIADYCCITEAIKKADKADVINIRTNGKSSWPQKNTEQHIERVLSKISFAAAQGEYFNNPVTEGKVFKNIIYGAVPPLKQFRYLIAYGDPSPSNNETKKNSYKVVVLAGRVNVTFYIIKVFLEQTQNSEFVNWYYNMREFVNERAQVYNYIENNTLQDPFYQQVFIPLFFTKGKETGHLISIQPDERKKPDKYARIEGTLEPVNRMGCLVFNEDERNNPHMQRLIEQFKAVSPKNKHLIDGPDACEGAVWLLNNRNQQFVKPDFIKNNVKHKYRY